MRNIRCNYRFFNSLNFEKDFYLFRQQMKTVADNTNTQPVVRQLRPKWIVMPVNHVCGTIPKMSCNFCSSVDSSPNRFHIGIVVPQCYPDPILTTFGNEIQCPFHLGCYCNL